MVGRLKIGDNRAEVYYIGYRLKTTPCEYKILVALSENERCTSEFLASVLGFDNSKRGNVAVHVCSLNRKSEFIGGRRLILCEGSEYYFNERM